MKSKSSKTLLILGSLVGGLFLSGCSDDKSDPPYINNGNNNGTTTNTSTAAPVAVDDSYSGRVNAQITTTAANGVLSVDTLNGATITASTNPAHGTLVLNADGSFTYAPVSGYSGTDSFTYTLSNSAGSSTATVTITLSGVAVYVSNQATAGGDGSQAHPLQTLAAAVSLVSGVAGAQIVVAQGDGTSTGYSTSVMLSAGQSLVGLSSTAPPVLTGPINFTSENTLQNVQIIGTTGTAVNATSASNGTISGVTIANCTFRAVDLANALGIFTLSNCAVSNTGENAFDAVTQSGNLTWSVANCTFSNTTDAGVVSFPLGNSAAQSVTVTNCTFTKTNTGVVGFSDSLNTNCSLTMTNNTVNGDGVTLNGLDISTSSTTNYLIEVINNNITGCIQSGIAVAAGGTSLTKARFQGNRTLGNQVNAGFGVNVLNSATLDAIFQGNTSDQFNLSNAGTAFNVEQFSDFASLNTGSLVTTGTITSVPAGSLNIP